MARAVLSITYSYMLLYSHPSQKGQIHPLKGCLFGTASKMSVFEVNCLFQTGEEDFKVVLKFLERPAEPKVSVPSTGEIQHLCPGFCEASASFIDREVSFSSVGATVCIEPVCERTEKSMCLSGTYA